MSRALHLRRPPHILLRAAAAALLLGGCGFSAPELTPATRQSTSSKSGSWIAQAWQGWQRAQANPTRPIVPQPRLALRPPAPLQPPLLQRIALTPPAVALPNLGLSSVLSSEFPPAPSFELSTSRADAALASTGGMWARALREVEAAPGLLRSSRVRLAGVSSTWAVLQEQVEARQVRALQNLALRVAAQRRRASADEEGLLRIDLDEDLQRVGRLDVGTLIPTLPPEERLQRLGELRLKLISALAIAPTQQRRADEERERIETQIRALLRQQEIERAALLGKLRREVPARLESQRNTEIQRALSQIQRADASDIAALLQQQQGRVRLDFAIPARLDTPATDSPASSGTSSSSAQISFNKNQFRTVAVALPSLSPIEPPATFTARRQVPASSRTPLRAPSLGERGAVDFASGAGEGEQARRWRALMQKRARAWRAPAR